MTINTNHPNNIIDVGADTLTLTANKYRLGSDVYDDMQGITSSVTGGSALGTLALRDTGITIPSFQDGADDVLNVINELRLSASLRQAFLTLQLTYLLKASAISRGRIICV